MALPVEQSISRVPPEAIESPDLYISQDPLLQTENEYLVWMSITQATGTRR